MIKQNLNLTACSKLKWAFVKRTLWKLKGKARFSRELVRLRINNNWLNKGLVPLTTTEILNHSFVSTTMDLCRPSSFQQTQIHTLASTHTSPPTRSHQGSSALDLHALVSDSHAPNIGATGYKITSQQLVQFPTKSLRRENRIGDSRSMQRESFLLTKVIASIKAKESIRIEVWDQKIWTDFTNNQSLTPVLELKSPNRFSKDRKLSHLSNMIRKNAITETWTNRLQRTRIAKTKWILLPGSPVAVRSGAVGSLLGVAWMLQLCQRVLGGVCFEDGVLGL